MWHRSSSKQPVLTYAIPPNPPAATAAAYETFERFSSAYAALCQELRDTQEALKHDVAEATQEAAAAHVDGRKPPQDPAKVKAAHEGRIRDIEDRLPQAKVELDLAGNRLADAIVEDRADWIAESSVREQAFADRFRTRLEEADADVGGVGAARGAQAWLRNFNRDEAYGGVQQEFRSDRLTVEVGDIRRNDTNIDPRELLRIARRAVDPPPPPRVILGVSDETRFGR